MEPSSPVGESTLARRTSPLEDNEEVMGSGERREEMVEKEVRERAVPEEEESSAPEVGRERGDNGDHQDKRMDEEDQQVSSLLA